MHKHGKQVVLSFLHWPKCGLRSYRGFVGAKEGEKGLGLVVFFSKVLPSLSFVTRVKQPPQARVRCDLVPPVVKRSRRRQRLARGLLGHLHPSGALRLALGAALLL
jgi:hypothetical protein